MLPVVIYKSLRMKEYRYRQNLVTDEMRSRIPTLYEVVKPLSWWVLFDIDVTKELELAFFDDGIAVVDFERTIEAIVDIDQNIEEGKLLVAAVKHIWKHSDADVSMEDALELVIDELE